MVSRTLKPWPRDAVMIVAATPEAARRDQMESAEPAECRDCGRRLVVDGYTLRRALTMPARRGRPVRYFCVECYGHYDVGQCNIVEDHRGRTP